MVRPTLIDKKIQSFNESSQFAKLPDEIKSVQSTVLIIRKSNFYLLCFVLIRKLSTVMNIRHYKQSSIYKSILSF